MRQRSEDREDFAGAFGPEGPSMPPPASNGPGQRRFDRMFALITGLVVLAIIAGMVVYFGTRGNPKPTPPPANDPRKDVEAAYLAYDNTLTQAVMNLDSAPLERLTTPAGFQQEKGVILYDSQRSAHYHLQDDHRDQIVVYSDGNTASVDDNGLQHRTPLDPATGRALGSEEVLPFHQSTALVKQNGQWLVDSVVMFGGATADATLGLSYAAKYRNAPLDPSTSRQIEGAYLQFWQVQLQAFKSLDTTGFAGVILDPALSKDVAAINAARAANKAYEGTVEHNYRIAESDASTAFVYDTFRDSTVSMNPLTHQPLQAQQPTVRRQTVELKNVGNLWKVDGVTEDT